MRADIAVRSFSAAVLTTGMLGALALAPAPAAAATSTLRTGFLDFGVSGLAEPERSAWLRRATSVGASVMRIDLIWYSVAPNRPPESAAADPNWAGYSFAAYDGQVKAAVAAGMTVLLDVSRAPKWAEGAGKPKNDQGYPGNWKPDAAAYGQFVTAVAKRYSGTTPDPSAPGQMLPKVTDFQLWNEPNLHLYLAPQYEGGKPFAPIRWRELVNAGTDAVKSVQPGANVVAAGLAPFGDPVAPNARRTRPVAFLRDALCLSSSLAKACGDVTRADTFAYHPYAVDRPGRAARDPEDATVPDAGRVQAVLGAAKKAGTIGSNSAKLWVTEVSYDSKGPDPEGVPLDTRARYISETMWRLWRAGVSTVVWFNVRDEAPTPSFASTYQSGIFYRGGRRKSDSRAFRFPLLVTGKNSKRMNVWLRTPHAGSVSVQVRKGSRWTTVNRGRLKANQVANVKVARPKVNAVRAIAGKATSYVWTVK